MSQKDRIAEVFESHVLRDGYGKATLDEVARELHISKKTIYVHFDGKADIYRHIVERRARQEQLRMRSLVGGLATQREKVETLVRFVIAAGRAHVAETTEQEWLEEYEVAADAFKKAHGDLLREFVAAGIESGEFEGGDPRLVERMVAAMVGEYLVMVNAEAGFDRDDELVGRILRFIG